MSIAQFDTAVSEYATAHDQYEHGDVAYMDAELSRPSQKILAIQRIMERPNDLTGKPHSFSSAEQVVESDPAYAGLLRALVSLRLQRERLIVRRDIAKARMTYLAHNGGY